MPELSASLRLCAVGGLDLTDFLKGRATPTTLETPIVPIRRERHRRIDWHAVELALRGALDAEVDPPLVLTNLFRPTATAADRRGPA